MKNKFFIASVLFTTIALHAMEAEEFKLSPKKEKEQQLTGQLYKAIRTPISEDTEAEHVQKIRQLLRDGANITQLDLVNGNQYCYIPNFTKARAVALFTAPQGKMLRKFKKVMAPRLFTFLCCIKRTVGSVSKDIRYMLGDFIVAAHVDELVALHCDTVDQELSTVKRTCCLCNISATCHGGLLSSMRNLVGARFLEHISIEQEYSRELFHQLWIITNEDWPPRQALLDKPIEECVQEEYQKLLFGQSPWTQETFFTGRSNE